MAISSSIAIKVTSRKQISVKRKNMRSYCFQEFIERSICNFHGVIIVMGFFFYVDNTHQKKRKKEKQNRQNQSQISIPWHALQSIAILSGC